MEKYSRLNVKELKSLLIKRNAKTNGKKSELVERLMVLDNASDSLPIVGSSQVDAMKKMWLSGQIQRVS